MTYQERIKLKNKLKIANSLTNKLEYIIDNKKDITNKLISELISKKDWELHSLIAIHSTRNSNTSI